ncbi:MAG: DUF1150 family protein [Minwuia sp.]|uniref:DUF1150 family protein n=1 Tax=Minwuia sp. TaxID=2493630 RepID=UPI003A879E84
MSDTARDIKQMTPEMVAAVGQQAMAYVRPVELEGGQTAYGIFAANGQHLGVAPSRELAFITVRQHELMPVSVH